MRFRNHKQRGQTLIETIVAIFILVMGISTSLGLAIYSFHSSDDATKSTVGTALAEQAVEGLRNYRDQEWLSTPSANCSFGGISQTCYPSWWPWGTGAYAFDYYTANGGSIGMTQNPASYGLYYSPSTNLYYSQSSSSKPGDAKLSSYYRKVQVYLNNTAPYRDDSGNPEQAIVISTVWWSSRRCPTVSDPLSLPDSCRVVLEMHLTNWRNF